jgi:hypothetical protein
VDTHKTRGASSWRLALGATLERRGHALDTAAAAAVHAAARPE